MKTQITRILCGAMLLAIPSFAMAQPPAPPTKETFAADIKPGALWDGREKVPFKAMDYPKMAKASEADFLDDEDYVLGFSQGGQARAYPLRYAWWHHIINDKFKQEDGTEAFVTVTY